MGNDYYERLFDDEKSCPLVGKNVTIERAIVDKNVTIEDNCIVSDKSNHADYDGDLYYTRDGITIIRRGVVIKSGTKI